MLLAPRTRSDATRGPTVPLRGSRLGAAAAGRGLELCGARLARAAAGWPKRLEPGPLRPEAAVTRGASPGQRALRDGWMTAVRGENPAIALAKSLAAREPGLPGHAERRSAGSYRGVEAIVLLPVCTSCNDISYSADSSHQ